MTGLSHPPTYPKSSSCWPIQGGSVAFLIYRCVCGFICGVCIFFFFFFAISPSSSASELRGVGRGGGGGVGGWGVGGGGDEVGHCFVNVAYPGYFRADIFLYIFILFYCMICKLENKKCSDNVPYESSNQSVRTISLESSLSAWRISASLAFKYAPSTKSSQLRQHSGWSETLIGAHIRRSFFCRCSSYNWTVFIKFWAFTYFHIFC